MAGTKSVQNVKISKIENQVVVDCKNCPKIINESEHKIGFRLLHFSLDTANQTYNIETENPENTIRKLVAYLKEYQIEYEIDSHVSKIITDRNERLKSLGISRNIGNIIKKQKSHKMVPPNFDKSIKILDFQKESIDHAVHVENVANFSIPGAGKTLMTYASFDILKNLGKVDQLFVIGPLPSMLPWEEQFSFCFNKKPENHIVRYLGTIKQRREILRDLKNFEVVLTSVPTAVNDLENLKQYALTTKKKIMMVIDESHHIKNFRDDARFSIELIELGKVATRRCILTGTPIPHGWEDLWTQIQFLWPEHAILGSRDQYKQLIAGFDREKEISERINFLWTRVTNSQMKSELPKMNEIRQNIPMDPIQSEIYGIIESGLQDEDSGDGITNDKVTEWRRNKVLRLLQAATNPKLIIERDPIFELDPMVIDNSELLQKLQNYNKIPNKIREVAEFARKLANSGKNVLIFTLFVGNVDYLFNILSDMKPIPISGEIDLESNEMKDVIGREERINEFKDWNFPDGKGRILIASIGSLSESVSLHKNKMGKSVCNHVIYLERSYNAGQFMQSLYRVYRIGSIKNKPVNYYYFQSRFNDRFTDTIDDTIDLVLRQRMNLLYRILNDRINLHTISLATATHKIGKQSQFYGPDEDFDSIMNKVRKMISNHKQKKKI